MDENLDRIKEISEDEIEENCVNLNVEHEDDVYAKAVTKVGRDTGRDLTHERMHNQLLGGDSNNKTMWSRAWMLLLLPSSRLVLIRIFICISTLQY